MENTLNQPIAPKKEKLTALQRAYQNRFASVELLRGLAALVVCLYHLTEGFANTGNFMKTLFHKGYLGVQVFFVISGFVIPLSMYKSRYTLRHIGHFLAKRLIRIEIPYWISIFLYILKDAIHQWIKGYDAMPIDWGNVALHVFHANGLFPQFNRPWICGVYWSLAIEVQYYILIALCFTILFHTNIWLRWTGMIIWAFCGIYASDKLVIWYTPYFLIGIVAAQHAVKLTSLWEFRAALILSLYFVYWDRAMDHFLACIISVGVIFYVHPSRRWAVLMGEISYSVYLNHILIGWTFLVILYEYYKVPYDRTLMIGVATLLSVLFSYFFFHTVEKQAIKISQKIKY